MSREHLHPRAISDLIAEGTKDWHYFLEKADEKFVVGEPTIKDVCQECNNGPLSRLDSYAHSLFKNYCDRILRENESVEVRYDWIQLSRWILKVHFNSARMHEREAELLSPYRDYILGRGSPPKRFCLYGFAIKPYHPDIEQEIEMSRLGMEPGPLEPDMLRISVLRFPTAYKGPKVARAIIYRSIGFAFLLAPRKTSADDMARFCADFEATEFRPKRVLPNRQGVSLVADSVDQLRAVRDHFGMYEEIYDGFDEWLGRRRK